MYAKNFRIGWWVLIPMAVFVVQSLHSAEVSRITALLRSAGSRSAVASIDEGRQLFIKQFKSGPEHEGSGDGLGPVFNHVSCAACHHQGGVGGGGGIEFNVALLCAQFDGQGPRPDQKLLTATLKGMHPAFVNPDQSIVSAILLHRFGPGERYFQFKTALGGQAIPLEPTDLQRDTLQRLLAKQPLPTAKTRNHVRLVRAQRNTTALFGAGLIDQLPDYVFIDLAAAQAAKGEVSGRVPPIGPDKVGRFGWRGQQEHLHDFVLGACANELGLEVPGNPQPINPLRPAYRPKALDLTSEQCQSLTSFVASLKPPRETEPLIQRQRDEVARGRNLFVSAGCAACHVQRLGPIEGIYGDLLLHDMGPGLVDPVLAEATLVLVKQQRPEDDKLVMASLPRLERPQPVPQPPTPNMYYGGSTFQSLALTGRPPTTIEIADPTTGIRSEYRVQQTSLESEWRTPPLWGVASSAPYLHDGRAATLLEAINLHGGEAATSLKRFQALEADERRLLLAFVRSLEVP